MSRSIIERTVILPFHLALEIAFIALLLLHIILSLMVPVHWRNLWRKFSKGSFSTTNWIKLIQRLSGYLLIVLAGLVILTGLDWYGLGLRDLVPFLQHIRYDIFMIITIAVHVAIGVHFALKRHKVRSPLVTLSILTVLVMSVVIIGLWDSNGLLLPGSPYGGGTLPDDGSPHIPPLNGTIPNPPQNTKPNQEGIIQILQDVYSFFPENIETVRPDIFQPGYFSMFDILVHLDSVGQITMEYHFDESMDTHVIDSLYGASNWWYEAIYQGGWPERNVFRMDHYPWKDGASLKLISESSDRLNSYHTKFREEVQRLNANNGQLIIPEVTISGESFFKTFTNVLVTPYSWRTDVFTNYTITALDVIFSLAEQGHITYEVEWIETIFDVTIQHYWVQGIDDDIASGRCGFVYESGYQGIIGNHIHLPPDSRVLTSPEYVLFYWICI
jgi:hypothetical protein